MYLSTKIKKKPHLCGFFFIFFHLSKRTNVRIYEQNKKISRKERNQRGEECRSRGTAKEQGGGTIAEQLMCCVAKLGSTTAIKKRKKQRITEIKFRCEGAREGGTAAPSECRTLNRCNYFYSINIISNFCYSDKVFSLFNFKIIHRIFVIFFCGVPLCNIITHFY